MGRRESGEIRREDGSKPGSERVGDRSPCGNDRAEGNARFVGLRETVEVRKGGSEDTKALIEIGVIRTSIREKAKLFVEIVRDTFEGV